jgi:hypothetical protein
MTTLIIIEHAPLLDHIENADLEAVRTADPRTFDLPALDEFGTPRLPLVRAIELAVMMGAEDEAPARLAIVADMVRRYGPDRSFCPFVVLDGDNDNDYDDDDADDDDAAALLHQQQQHHYHHHSRAAPRLRWSSARAAVRVTPLSLALLQVNLYPEDIVALTRQSPPRANHNDNNNDNNKEEEEAGSDVALVRRLLHTLITDAGASPAADPSLFGEAVAVGLHELLPYLIDRGAAPGAPISSGCLHSLLRNRPLPPQRIVATLDALRCLFSAPFLRLPRLLLPLLLRPEGDDARARTALHRAATLERSCAAAVAARLLCLGACPFARDAEGCTPLALARAHTDERRLVLACSRCSPPVNRRTAWSARRAYRHACATEAVLVAAEAQAAAELALLMGLHPRLGAGASPLLRAIDPAVLRALVVVTPWRADAHAALLLLQRPSSLSSSSS